MSRHQNAGEYKAANRSFENVAQLKYFGRTVTNQNVIQNKKTDSVALIREQTIPAKCQVTADFRRS
jgi:hypothetical protein